MAEHNAGDPQIVADAELYRGFVRLSRVTFEIDWQGKRQRVDREVHDHGHVATIFPVDTARCMGLLIRQFRVTPFLEGEDGWLWEVPAGLLDGDPPAECARREAGEEAGVEVTDILPLGTVWTSPGIVKERIHLFWGVYAGPPPARTGGLDHENEMIEVHELPLSRIAELNDSGAITDAKSALVIHKLRILRPDLFDNSR